MSRNSRKTAPQMKAGRLMDFSGGMNNAVHPAMLNDNESTLIENYSLDEKGTLFPIKGRKNRYPGGVGNKPINGIADYTRSDGASRLLIGVGNSLYVDTPRLIYEIDGQAEWNEGIVGQRITTEKVPGELHVKRGIENGIDTATGETTGGTAGYTYGWTITPKKNIRVSGFRLRGLLTDKDYKLTIWKVSDQSVVLQYTGKPASGTAWNDIDTNDSALLEKNVAYRIGVFCATANFMKYWTGGTAHAELTRGNSFYKTSDGFPETAWSTNIPGVDIKFDVVDLYHTMDSDAEWNAGTHQQTTISGGKLRLAVDVPSFSRLDTTKVDWDAGTLTNVSTAEVDGSVVLARQA